MIQNSYRTMADDVEKFIKEIKRNGTKPNTKNKLINLRKIQEKRFYQLIKNSIGTNTYSAIANRISLPPNRVINNMRRANSQRWAQQRKNLQRTTQTRRVITPRGFI